MNSKPGLAKLGMKASHRNLMLRNQLNDLLTYEHLETTLPKAKALIIKVNRVIRVLKSSKEKINLKHALFKICNNQLVVDKLLNVYSKRFKNLNSGFVSIYKLGYRKGDHAQKAKLILHGYQYKEIGKKSKQAEQTEKEIKEDPNKKFLRMGRGEVKKSQTEETKIFNPVVLKHVQVYNNYEYKIN
jgi:large subunit ribosomal protein L17